MTPAPIPPRPSSFTPAPLRLRTAAPRPRPSLSLVFSPPSPQPPPETPPTPPAPPSSAAPPPPDDQTLFLQEAKAELLALAAHLERSDWTAVLSEIHRHFHTLRGSAATLGYAEIARLASEGEQQADALLGANPPSADPSGHSLRQIALRIATDLQLEIPFPSPQSSPSPSAPAGEPSPAPSSLTPPVPQAHTPPPSLSALESALENWIHQTPDGQNTFLHALSAFRSDLQAARQSALDQSCADLQALVQDWGAATPPPPMQAVLRRCLDDARTHLTASPPLPWRRRWHLTFRSLRIALSAQWNSNSTSGPATPPETPTPASDLDPEMIAAFVEEAQTLLDPIEAAALAWERGEHPDQQRAELRRHFHTLKGAANSVGLRTLGASMHTAEDLFQSGDLGPQTPAWLMARLDELRAHLQALAANPATPWPHHWTPPAATASGQPAAAEPVSPPPASLPPEPKAESVSESPALRIPAERLRSVMDASGELLAHLVQSSAYQESLTRQRATLEDLRQSVIAWAEQERAGHSPGPEAWQTIETTLASALTHLSNLRQQFNAANATQISHARRIQGELADFNMAPVSGLFRRLQRVFRDALQAEQKQAELTLEGGRTRLDREIIERLYGPLLHLLRNAVAHGIESPAERAAHGKPASGRVRLAATALPGAVLFEVEDDGAGIRTDAVRARAIERRLLPPDTAAISAEDAVRLLFTPGFSTRQAANEVAGRGVGLDVVKAEVESMGGTVSVRSTAGQGACWSIRVPLNLATTEALLVRAGALHVAIPLSYVIRCRRLSHADLCEQHGRILCAGENLNCYALHELLGSSAGEDATHGVIVDGGSFQAVLGVHEIIARREAIRKDPGPLLSHLPFLSGVIPQADGSLLPLLHIPELLRRLGTDKITTPPPALPTLRRVLIVDDSPSVRRAHQILLEKIGCQVETVADGTAALLKLKESSFDILITDQGMPGLNGLELVRALRRDRDLSGLRAFVVTSRRENSLIRALADVGATWLPKPLDLATLRAALA